MQYGLMAPEVPDENSISRGCITMQFSFYVSELSLMEYESTRSVRTLSAGPFTLKTIKQINCPILAHICCVDKFKWPLTKDSVILRVTTRTFVIALPGLLYALQFPGLCCRHRLRILSNEFRENGHYRDLRKMKLGGCSMEYNKSGMLTTLRPHFEPIAQEILLEIGNIPGLSRFCMEEHNSSFLRACRMSVITKTIMESMRVKTMTISLVDIKESNTPDEEQPSRAYAVASTYTRLVDAAEYASLVSCGLGEQLENVVSPLRFSTLDFGYKVWNLNEIGLLTFMSRFEPEVNEEVENVTAQEKWWNDTEKTVEVGVSGEDKVGGNSSHCFRPQQKTAPILTPYNRMIDILQQATVPAKTITKDNCVPAFDACKETTLLTPQPAQEKHRDTDQDHKAAKTHRPYNLLVNQHSTSTT
ncbi:hypothetical protein VNO80_04905 [Phaseolus coccineus]|uniref:Uncharacterized protein n=1 Tax=Phaseolus coccineus TaxID=3886 RepID=A0AAN9RP21_PHACN